MRHLKVCILGGAGFVGRSIASRLAVQGHEVVILTRRRERHRDMLVNPTLILAEGDVHNPAFLQTRFQGVDVVINLVGILNERGHRGHGFRKAHVELAENVVDSMRQAKLDFFP